MIELTAAELSRLAHVSRSAISQVSAPGGPLHPALVGPARYDRNHPAVVAYVQRGVARSQAAAARRGRAVPRATRLDEVAINIEDRRGPDGRLGKSPRQPPPKDPNERRGRPPRSRDDGIEVADPPQISLELAAETLRALPAEIQELSDWPLRSLIRRFGPAAVFSEWLSAQEKIEKIRQLRIQNETREGELVPRAEIHRLVIDPLDTAFRQLLSDGVRTITKILSAKIQAGITLTECEQYLHDQIAGYIREGKALAVRGIKNAR